MSVNDLLNQEDPANIKRDRWGRYLLADPETGEEKAWTRATTIADTLADRFALEKWMQRNLVFGIGRRADLFAKASSVASVDERDTLGKIIDEAFDAAASSSAANLGTALHRFAERVDRGETVDIPDPWAADIAAYRAEMDKHRITVVPSFTERVLLVPEIEAAGTTDRLLQAPQWHQPRIGDLKSGKSVTERMTEITLQLAIYAHATHWYDPQTNAYHDMPEVDQQTAIVMHVPVGQAACVLFEVDIEAGWEAVQLAMDVRSWRKRKRLAFPIGAPATATPAAPTPAEPAPLFDQRWEWVKGWVLYIVNEHGLATELAEVWAQSCPDVPTFRNGGPRTDEEIDRLAGTCNVVEAVNGLLIYDRSDPARVNKPKSKLHKELLPS